MPTVGSMPIRQSEKILTLTLALYAVLSLVSMATMSIGVAIVIAAYLWNIKVAGAPHFSSRGRSLMFKASVALALTCFLSLLVAWVWPLGYGGKFVQVEWLKDIAKIWYLFLPFIFSSALLMIKQDDRRTVIKAWLVAYFLLSILGITQYFTGWPKPQLIPSGGWNRYHATMFLGFHLSVASIFIFPYYVCMELMLRKRGSEICGLPRWFLVAASLTGTVVLFATYSRTIWIALPLGILFMVVVSLRRKWLIPVILAMGLAGFAAMQLHQVRARLADGYALNTRSELWKINAEFLKERPLTGAGWHHNLELSGYYALAKDPARTDFFGGHAHNNLVEMLGSTGLLGTVAWLFWCGVAVILAWKVRRRGLGRAIVAAWIVFHLNGMTQVNFWESKVLHQIMWAVAWCLVWMERNDA